MFPMVGSLDDWRRAREAFLDVKEELTASGVDVYKRQHQPHIGVYIRDREGMGRDI